jgi:hypothetical protein
MQIVVGMFDIRVVGGLKCKPRGVVIPPHWGLIAPASKKKKKKAKGAHLWSPLLDPGVRAGERFLFGFGN